MPLIADLTKHIRNNESGIALLEFALSLPIVLGISLYAIECANLALMNMRVSQAALALADNASRIDVDTGLITQTLREDDINDVFAGARTYGSAWGLSTNGRVTLFSLEKKSGTQRIHWQRCMGQKSGASYDGHYDQSQGKLDIYDGTDTAAANQGVLQPNGIGDTGNLISTPDDSALIFVEINYDYKPVVSARWLPGGSALIHSTASFLVRDRRDLSKIYASDADPSRTMAMTCDKYAS